MLTPQAAAVRRPLIVGAAVLAVVAALVGADLFSDLGEGVGLGHVALEGSAVVLAAVGAAWLLYGLRQLSRERDDAREEAQRQHAEAARWRQEAEASLRGLGAAIDDQFARWSLSPAEREVAMLLLKGLSMKEVATARGVSERTARQQATAVYQKSGLSGRADLAAFFLEDLLLPTPPA